MLLLVWFVLVMISSCPTCGTGGHVLFKDSLDIWIWMWRHVIHFYFFFSLMYSVDQFRDLIIYIYRVVFLSESVMWICLGLGMVPHCIWELRSSACIILSMIDWNYGLMMTICGVCVGLVNVCVSLWYLLMFSY